MATRPQGKGFVTKSTRRVLTRAEELNRQDGPPTDGAPVPSATQTGGDLMVPRSSRGDRAPVAHPEKDAIERLRDLLVAQREEGEALAGERIETADALAGQLDPDSILEREIAEASAARARRAVEEIDDALSRMDEGSYGTCEVCGRPIPVARLEVMPYARTCAACAADQEQRGSG